MTDATITTTVTLADLRSAYDDELDDLREAYDDAVAFIREEWGEDALDRPIPTDAADLDDEEMQNLVAMAMTAEMYEESAKTIQKRNHALDKLGDQLDGDTFELRMLTGAELMQIGTDLRVKAKNEGVEKELVDHHKKEYVVDAVTVAAPEGIPTDGDGSPMPSRAGMPLTNALWEAAERLNESGAADFRAPGFGDEVLTPPDGSSATPPRSGGASKPLGTTEPTDPAPDTPDSGGS